MLPHYGMKYGAKQKYGVMTPGARMKSIRHLDPNPGTDLNADKVISFRLVLSDVEWGRLVNAPFLIKFKASYENPDFNAAGATNEIKAKKHFIRPSSSKPAVILPDSLNASCLFERVDVFINGVDVQEHTRFGGLQFLYQSFNRMFSRREQRERFDQHYVIDSTLDTTLTEKSEDLKKALSALDAVAYNSGGSRVFSFGFDGVPYLSGSRNLALASLQGHEFIDNVTLPPNSVLDIHLQKRIPIYTAWQSLAITSGNYFKPEAHTADLPVIELEIEELQVVYESLVPNPGASIERQLKASQLRMFFDLPVLSYQTLHSGLQRQQLNVSVPEGSLICYAAIMYGHQLWYSASDKKPISGMTQFPENLTEAVFTLAGHDVLGQGRGFKNFGGSDGYTSPSAKLYHSELVENRVVDCAFHDLFPPGLTQKSYRQAFFLDLRSYRIRETTNMTVELSFDTKEDKLSPEKSYFVTCFVREVDINRKGKEWKLSLIK